MILSVSVWISCSWSSGLSSSKSDAGLCSFLRNKRSFQHFTYCMLIYFAFRAKSTSNYSLEFFPHQIWKPWNWSLVFRARFSFSVPAKCVLLIFPMPRYLNGFNFKYVQSFSTLLIVSYIELKNINCKA